MRGPHPSKTVKNTFIFSRHMMQSVEIQNVVSIRASDDYQPGNNQWDVGLTDIWTWAIGLAPFKDTFWTRGQIEDALII